MLLSYLVLSASLDCVGIKCIWVIWTLFSKNLKNFLLLSRSEFAGNEAQNSDKQVLNIYDLCNKFIAYSSIFDDVVDVLAEWGSLYVLTRDGKIHVLQEKDAQTKLEACKSVNSLLYVWGGIVLAIQMKKVEEFR